MARYAPGLKTVVNGSLPISASVVRIHTLVVDVVSGGVEVNAT